MHLVLDECVNPRVRWLLGADHTVHTVFELGWGGLPDHVLVEHLQGRCDVFLTIDRGFEHQHNVPLLSFGIVIVHVVRNRPSYYQAIQDEISRAVFAVKPGRVLHVA